jgi:hypothetical protein
MKNWKELLVELGTFAAAALIMTIGVGLTTYYIKEEFTISSFIVGLCGFLILYPAFKVWQDRIKDLF